MVHEGSSLRMERKSTQLVDSTIPSKMPKKGMTRRLSGLKGSVYAK